MPRVFVFLFLFQTYKRYGKKKNVKNMFSKYNLAAGTTSMQYFEDFFFIKDMLKFNNLIKSHIVQF